MFKNILVPIHLEYKKNHKKLFVGALSLLDKENGKMTLLNIDENSAHSRIYPILDENNEHEYEQSALKILKEIAEENSLPIDKVSFVIEHGSVYQKILEEAEKIKADTIVMMATKPGLDSYFISSTAARVVRHSSCEVLIIRLNGD
jgi:nucleotide-binding universal stress UspA family protein